MADVHAPPRQNRGSPWVPVKDMGSRPNLEFHCYLASANPSLECEHIVQGHLVEGVDGRQASHNNPDLPIEQQRREGESFPEKPAGTPSTDLSLGVAD